MQTITSADTSLNQIPAIFKNPVFLKYQEKDRMENPICFPHNLDIGGGRYDTASDYLMETYGIVNIVWDPYNRTEAENRNAMENLKQSALDQFSGAIGHIRSVTVSNVLNVINDDQAMESTITLAAAALVPVFFTVYEGDKSGEGKETPKGYQRNAPTKAYVPFIQKHFRHVERHGKIIQAWN